MALPDYPITRNEQYLNRAAGGSGAIPDYPITREEQYLAKIAEGGGGGGDGGFKVTFVFDDDFNVTADKTYAEVKAAVEAGEFVYGTASITGLGVGSVVCGGILDDGVIHFVSTGMEVVEEDNEQRIVMIWFNYKPDGTFDFNLENPPYKNPLPYVDASDNGKILKVVDGKWEVGGGGDLLFGVIWEDIDNGNFQINANGQWEDFNAAILEHKPVNFAFDMGRMYTFPNLIEAAEEEGVSYIAINFADISLAWLSDGTIIPGL